MPSGEKTTASVQPCCSLANRWATLPAPTSHRSTSVSPLGKPAPRRRPASYRRGRSRRNGRAGLSRSIAGPPCRSSRPTERRRCRRSRPAFCRQPTERPNGCPGPRLPGPRPARPRMFGSPCPWPPPARSVDDRRRSRIRLFPSGVKNTNVPLPAGSSSRRRPSAASERRTIPEESAEANVLPSGEKATDRTPSGLRKRSVPSRTTAPGGRASLPAPAGGPFGSGARAGVRGGRAEQEAKDR